MNDTNETTRPAAPNSLGKGLRRLLLGAAFAATFVAGGLVMSGSSAIAMMEMGHGMGGHGGMHQMGKAHIEHMLKEVDATPEQTARIESILHTGFAAMGPVHEKLASTHGDLHRLLTAPTIDRAALEQLRAARVADIDQASKTMVQAMADAAEVLTPDQRAKLATVMAAEHHHHD
ncbi:Spy/CpxP family protein refolding chaperone [Phenylobacterium montanum]|uniref:Spy/CpxP family protein refolding chaperone n=1 Tax=Phenylobacterium montanum TaxID=2823693 RepID=A0A975FYJ8_9CAUL|nr:Spy/CpxP family protein refolding chaperone [Caulobacter sp. S6]QUD87559.1 Spy/CpxP family protein refolding chaperone [Caulobacter sp. S6]